MILTTGIHTELKKNTLTNQSEFVSLFRKEFRIPETRKMRGKKKKQKRYCFFFFFQDDDEIINCRPVWEVNCPLF